MTETTRNLAVGVTVLAALAILAGLILLFTGLPWYLQSGYLVYIAAESTHDVHPGDTIHLAGMRVGRITEVTFTDPSRPYGGVTITARIDEEISLPGNVVAEFYTKGLAGATWTELKPTGPTLKDPATNKAIEVFPIDGSIFMPSRHVGESMLPRELLDAMGSLTSVAENINKLISPQPAPEGLPPTTVPSTAPGGQAGLQATVAKLNRTLDAMSAVLGDAENQANIKVSLANLAKATDAATETMNELKRFAVQAAETAEDFSGLADKVIVSAEEVSTLMAAVNRLATKVEAGEGTAGKLLGDPELYNSFLEATEQMGLLMAELRELVEAWQAGGVEIKLK